MPFRLQEPEDGRVLELSVHLIALPEHALTLKPESLKKTQASTIPGINVCLDPMETKNIECEVDHGSNGARGFALPPTLAVERKPDLAATMGLLKSKERTRPDHCSRVAVHNTPLEQVAIGEGGVNFVD